MNIGALDRSSAGSNLIGYDVESVREDFPILKQEIYGKPLVFLDSAASAQKPRAVIEAMKHCYEEEYANIHRGVYYLSMRATEAFEEARDKVRRFLNAAESREIVFVRGATEAINLVAQSYGRTFLREGDEIVITAMEHHSNIVPWQFLRDEKGLALRVAPIDDDGEFLLEEYEKLLGPRTKLVSVIHGSNAIGTIVPVREIIRLAHARGIPVLVDGCQAVPHLQVDVQELDCDFYVFSGHKLYGPTGIGVLYGKAALLEAMPPYQGGGEMITSVTFEKSEFNAIPYKFEAGTPHIAGAIGLGAAIDYLGALGIEDVGGHERGVLEHATRLLSEMKGVRLVGTARDKTSILSFVIDGVHAHDVGTVLDHQGVAVRAGHHCAQPVMERFGVDATVRASFALYNTVEEAEALAAAVAKVGEIFG
ncbi:MAG: cysteine desulfurase [Alphaproteobacteria bacterium]|nr:cysteine desulfurase [Alphaproteobacteria bacterium]